MLCSWKLDRVCVRHIIFDKKGPREDYLTDFDFFKTYIYSIYFVMLYINFIWYTSIDKCLTLPIFKQDKPKS